MLFLKMTIYNYASRETLELTNFLHIPNSKYCMAYTLHAMHVVSLGHAIMTIKFLVLRRRNPETKIRMTVT